MPDETPRDGWADGACPAPIAEALRRPVDLGPGARARLAAALAAEPRPVGAHRALLQPVTFRVPPLAAIAAAAGLVIAGVLGGMALARVPVGAPAGLVARAPSSDARVVRFVLVAPDARGVSLVGDFNGWDASRTPMRPAGEPGLWVVELPVASGRHVYAFVVDGTRWVADPAAPLAPEDGFGSRNSVLVVGAET